MNLNEISMKPSDLRSRVAKLTDALVGIEFELIVKDVGFIVNPEILSEPDYSTDELVCDWNWDALSRDIQNFFVGAYNSRIYVQHAIQIAKDDYNNWVKETWNEYVEDQFDDWLHEVHSKEKKDLNHVEISNYYNEFKSTKYNEFIEEGEGRLERYISYENLSSMKSWEERFSLYWPNYTDSEDAKYVGTGSQDLVDIARSFRIAVGIPVEYSTKYHSITRNSNSYVLEPDESLKSKNTDDVGLEFVSPPITVDKAIEQIQKVKSWCIDDDNAYTNATCGLHINVSFPNFRLWDLDYVKLVVFLGDDYISKQFGRLGNAYATSSIEKIKDKIDSKGPELVTHVLDYLKKALYSDASSLIHRGLTDKYVTINPKDDRVEFRSPGGNWLNMNIDKVINTLLRFVVVLDIALDPEKFKKEYASKLYKLISPKSDDAIALFSLYQSGNISKSELKIKWAKLIKNKKDIKLKTRRLADKFIDKNYWNLYNSLTRKIVTTIEADTRDEALRKATNYVNTNNPDMYWYIHKVE